MSIHGPNEILRPRNVLSWALLAAAAGSVNAAALIACDRYVSHVTGTATRIGVDMGQWLLVFEYSMVFLCFLGGAALAPLMVERKPWHPLVLVSLVLTAAAIGGEAGYFGPFVGTPEEYPVHFVFLSLLAFGMGLQNASVALATGMVVRTTHVTGPTTDLGIAITNAFRHLGGERKKAIEAAYLRATKITGFIVGATVMLPLAGRFEYAALLVPAGAICVAMGMSFVGRSVTSKASRVESAAKLRTEEPAPVASVEE